VPGRSLVLGRNYRWSYPNPLLQRPQTRCKGRVMLSFVISFVIFTRSWDRLGWRAKGSL